MSDDHARIEEKKKKKKKKKKKLKKKRERDSTPPPSPPPATLDSIFGMVKRRKIGESSGKSSSTKALTQRVDRFEGMGLKEDLLRGIFAIGFRAPSAIQQRAIVPITSRRDVIAQSQSGTGKTAVMCIGSLQNLNEKKRHTQVLIVSPTRELAEQTSTILNTLGSFLNVRCYACTGGKVVGQDIKMLDKGMHVVSGTPGRILDMLRRRILNVMRVTMLVVDEADEMLQKGLKEQIYDIYRNLPRGLQIVLISATMPQEVLEMTDEFMTDPVSILVRQENVSLDVIKQFYVNVGEEEWKFDTLCDIYEMANVSQTIIFCNTRKKVEWLSKKMKQHGFSISSIHGKMPQKDRDTVTAEFRSGKTRVLIATDIYGRGIDVQQVSLVVCYDLPVNLELYIHRIGRTGRFGRKGCAINLITNKDIPELNKIQRHYSVSIGKMPGDVAKYM